MLTKKNPDGTWSVQGIDFKDCKGDMYGALCKLRDYEKTGLEPSDFDRIRRKIHIGSEISGYKVFGVWNKCCIAENPNAPDPYVVWKIEPSGAGVWGGRYFKRFQQAQKFFYHLAIYNKPDTTEYWKR